jgi:type VI protein secretion system component Hcp
VSNLDSIESFDRELDEQELAKVTAGGTKNATTTTTTAGPTESLSLNFTKVSWTYTQQH